MKRRSFIKRTVALSAVSTLMASTIPGALSKAKQDNSQPAGTIIHSVYFWLKAGITSSEEKEFLNFFKVLRKIPGVKTLSVGKPAPTTKRDVTDNTFDYNLIITFDNLKAINIYESHPEHVKAAQEYSKFWQRVQVRDTIIE